MRSPARLVALFTFAAVVVGMATPAPSAPVVNPHATSELVAATTSAKPGSALQVAVVQTLSPGWHTYWRNPGDAGEPPHIAWSLPVGWRAGGITWPAPKRLPVGPIMDYGYEGRVILPIALQVPETARPGAPVALRAALDYLVCAQVCVPGHADLSLTLSVSGAAPSADPVWAGPIAATLAAAPRPAGLTARFHKDGVGLVLAVAGPALAGTEASEAYFYPYDAALIDHGKPQAVERGPSGLTLTLAPGAAFAKPPAPDRFAGVLAVDGRTFEIAATPGAAPAGAAGLGPVAGAKDAATPSPELSTGVDAAAGTASLGLVAAVGLAFIGGIILNLMPCVFPILSMKAAALAAHAEQAGASRRQGLAFLAGVLATFLGLAVALILARAAGSAVGWGFQLQSPAVVAALALLMLAAALNLSGLFEIGTSVQGVGQGLAARSGLVGSILTGALAVLVAAPCTAPFMGPALGWALTQTAPAALAVFTGLGLGFAAPFTLLAFTPALMRRLPRPGPWMDTFRKALAFPMYAAAAWLAWVLAQQSGSEGLARLLAAGVALAFAAWLFGLGQRRRAEGGRARLSTATALVSAAFCVFVVAGAPEAASSPAEPSAPPAAGPVAAQVWSPARLDALRAAGKPVLVNFTAAWCVTCQVNERLAFASPDVAAAFRRTGAAYLVADWTRHDAVIAKALADQGRIGVPLYLVYGGAGGAPQVLPQLLTPSVVSRALDAAAGAPRLAALSPGR